MKKYLSCFIFLVFINQTYGQDTAIIHRKNEISIAPFGLTYNDGFLYRMANLNYERYFGTGNDLSLSAGICRGHNFDADFERSRISLLNSALYYNAYMSPRLEFGFGLTYSYYKESYSTYGSVSTPSISVTYNNHLVGFSNRLKFHISKWFFLGFQTNPYIDIKYQSWNIHILSIQSGIKF